MKLEKIDIIGDGVVLEPLSFRHLNGLKEVLMDGYLWEMKETVIPHPNQLPDFLYEAEKGFQAGEQLVFAILNPDVQRFVGCTRLRCIDLKNKKAVIGPTFIAPSWQRSHINTESKYLLLEQAFDVLKLNRVELHCDVLNTCSRKAIIRLGAKEEGVIRQNRIMPDGRIRNTVVYSIIQQEWLEVKQNLEFKMREYEFALSA